MATIHFTLDSKDILYMLKHDSSGAFAMLLQNSLNQLMQIESNEQLKAHPYERTEKRTDMRNGTRERQLYTRIGTLTLRVPRHRDQPFHTLVFENYQRSETALLVTLADMVVCGVSTRKVKHVVETLCGKSISKSSISEVCKVLDKDVKEFKNRRLSGFYPFVTLDATYLKVRANHRIVSRALMVAYATTDAGRREIIGFDVYEEESRRTWTDFLQGLKERGLVNPLMITSDAHKGMLHAIAKVYPLCPWQRCQFHFARNILDGVPKPYETAVSDELRELFTCDTIEKARKKKEEIIEEYEPVAEKAMRCLDDGFESAMTVMILPNWIRKYFRTSNHLERLNREIKRRANVIGIFPNEESILRLIGSLLLELNDVKAVGRSIFSRKTLEKMITPEIQKDLRITAEEEQRLLAA